MNFFTRDNQDKCVSCSTIGAEITYENEKYCFLCFMGKTAKKRWEKDDKRKREKSESEDK